MNFVASIFIGCIVFAFGSFWHSPILFGNYWTKKNKIDKSGENTSDLWKTYLAGILNNIVIATGFNFLFYRYGINELSDALILALVIWIAFMTPMLFYRVVWENRSLGAHVLDKLYFLFVILMIAILTFAWM